MRNLAYRTYNIESIKNEFLNIGFSEEAIDFVFLHNDNYNFEFLKEKIIDVEKNLRKDISNLDTKIDSVKNELNTKIDFSEKNLNIKIDSLDTKIDNVEKSLTAKIDSLDIKIDNVKNELNTKIDSVKNELNASNRTIQVILIMGITLAPIIYSIFNKYFLN
ncbi:Bdr family repetitive protein [Borreliella bissettiae]|uniref:KID repeat family protein n=1 Tax=Borrelia bissettiae (strain DSM 17990 / CIP 109136 / DN127) TaxID=521010 RepID=G0ANQ1_BORBD|nr:Bdr family repetitive protein [Borreliella bissettiae]AEL19327.1 KID repeat family protein [Borreliella bissettiae DN127]